MDAEFPQEAGIRICGVPDSVEAEAEINRWPDPAIGWFVANPGAFQGLAADAVLAAFQWAWSQWASVCGILPMRVLRAEEAHVLIECRTIDRPGGTLAWSELANGTSSPKQQRYDATEAWVSNQTAAVPAQRIDLGRVACHEIGHVLGIPHIAPPRSLMNPLYSAAIWGPQAADVAEARARYGPPLPTGQPTPPPAPSGEEWSLTVGGIAIRGTGTVTAASIPGFRVTRLQGG